MNLLQDVITYIRRIVKTPSNAQLSDNLIIDYINRFWLLDVDARIQLFDLKTKYGFQTTPFVTSYNMPLYGVNGYALQSEAGSQIISPYPVYQGATLEQALSELNRALFPDQLRKKRLSETAPVLVIEGYWNSGYNILVFQGRYYALSQTDGEFDPDKFQGRKYKSPAYKGDTIRDILVQLDKLNPPPLYPSTSGAPLPPELVVNGYRDTNYNIILFYILF